MTVKIPATLEQELVQLSQQAHVTKSELVRRPHTTPFVSALDQAGDLVGCFSGGPADLSSNSEYLKDFGQR